MAMRWVIDTISARLPARRWPIFNNADEHFGKALALAVILNRRK
jgi:hypothetical protein